MPKIAVLVEFCPRTRMVVDVPDGKSLEEHLKDDEVYDRLVFKARMKMKEELCDYLSCDNMSWEEDEVCPFGSLPGDAEISNVV